MVYHVDWFADTELSFYFWNKSHFIMVYDLFNVFWFCFSNILLKIFESMLMEGYWPIMFSFCSVFWFWNQSNADLLEWIGKLSLLFHFLELLEKATLLSVVEFTCEAIWFWTLVWWEFLITDSILFLVIGLFRFSISSPFSLGILCF